MKKIRQEKSTRCPVDPLPPSAGSGIAGKEEVLGEDAGEMSQKPTCTGAATTRHRSIRTGPN